jgi:DNA polymerase-3 subunit delta
MKLSTRDAAAYFRKPDTGVPAVLIYSQDPMRVADKRRGLTLALAGPEAEGEMRLTRIAAADLRKDGALLDDAMRAQSFFPGPRVVVVVEATDGLADPIKAALSDWREGDAHLIVTAGALAAKSALRKAFEGHSKALAVGLYDDPPGEAEIAEMIATAGLGEISSDVRAALTALSRSLEPGDFRQTVEKLGLYMRGESAPVTPEDVAACAPQSSEADLDDLIAVVAEGQREEIAGTLRKLYAQGVQPVGLCIGLLRHFRQLHTAASDPGGASQGIGKLRPPVWGPRRDRMARQASSWGREGLERALGLIVETDLTLRSTSRAPDHALVERTLIRLAMMARARS